MRLWVVVLALVACKSAPSGPAPGPAASAPPGTTASSEDAWAGAVGTGTIDAGSVPPDAPPAPVRTVTIYERGTFKTMPVSQATERDGCIGTPDALAACKQLQPNASCDLAPWYHAADVYCRGTPMQPTPPQPAEACACTCSAAYIKAYDEASKRARACSNVP